MKRWPVILGLSLTAAAAASLFIISAGRPTEAITPIFAPTEERGEVPQRKTLEIQYIANEGVLISSSGKRVLIDGLHRKYGDDYAFLPDVEREKMENARPPFDKIDLILVSHMHGDHFHPESVGLYLKNAPAARLVTSQQVVDQVAEKFAGFAEVKERVTPVVYTLKSRQPMRVAGVDLEILGVGHGTGRHASIQNLGHVITLGGKKLLHIGDAEISDEIFDAFDLEKQGIDVALLPYWFLTTASGQAVVERHIKPKHIIAVHVGPAEGAAIEAQVKQRFPAADIFKILLEKRSF